MNATIKNMALTAIAVYIALTVYEKVQARKAAALASNNQES